MEMGGKQQKKIMLKRGGGNSGPSCTERRRGRVKEERRKQWEEFRDAQTAGYTAELMLPQKAIFSSQAPHPLRR